MTSFDPKMFQFVCGMETTPTFHGSPFMNIICQDPVTTADLFFRLHALMMNMGVPMWADQTVIHFELKTIDPILAVTSYLSSYLRTTSQQAFMCDGILYLTQGWNVPVQI